LSTSNSDVALAKKMTKPETKTVKRTTAVPKTKIVKQQSPPQKTPKDTERTDFRLFVRNHRYQINNTTELNADNTPKVHGM
jgi:hypothetical protein